MMDDAGAIDGLGAIVLTGGRSSRMGRPKETLAFEGEPLLARVVGRVAAVARPVVVVAAPGQALPTLPPWARIARDAGEGGGPVEGLAAGFAAFGPEIQAVFVTTTDAPFVHAALVRRLVALRSTADGPPWDAVVPVVAGRAQPLCAIYATRVHAEVRAMLRDGQRRAGLLADRVRTLFADEAVLLADPALRAADGELLSLRGVNTPAEYEAALARGGA